MTIDPIPVGADALAAAKAYLRVDHTGDDATITGHLRASIAACENFINTLLLARPVEELREVGPLWTVLGAQPVTAITRVADALGVLPAGEHTIDIDADGRGRVRTTGPARRLTINYRAGSAADWAQIAEPMREGVLRHVGQLYAVRDADRDPAAYSGVLALWRGSRRMRLS